MHNWGVAFDICRADGKDPYDDSDGYFSKVGKVGKSLGLEWGGDWKFKDKPHFQLPDWGSTTEKLRTRYGTYEKFVKTWDADKPVANKTTTPVKKVETRMKTIKKGSKGKAVKVWQIIVGVVPDGKFGSGTEANTLTFQKKHKLTPDGKVGEKTWKAGLESL
jgi:peptidoglycan L-alanyl-D-glutamate endopeptidase CwlK